MNNAAWRGMSALACDACGQLPHPHRPRLTLAKLAAVAPIEALLHAAVLAAHPPYAVAVLTLAVTTTVLVIWVVEPSAMRLLGRWLHAPAIRHQERLHSAESLWRLRVTVHDRPGSLERLTAELARLQATILSLHVHPLESGARDELVVGTCAQLTEDELLRCLERAGGWDARAWPTTALALVDGQTKALTLAAQVSHRPEDLPFAIAEMLGARAVTDRLWVAPAGPAGEAGGGAGGGEAGGGETGHGEVLRVPSPWSGLFAFVRPEDPFTPAERARAHRLAQIAEAATITQARSGVGPTAGPGREDSP